MKTPEVSTTIKSKSNNSKEIISDSSKIPNQTMPSRDKWLQIEMDFDKIAIKNGSKKRAESAIELNLQDQALSSKAKRTRH